MLWRFRSHFYKALEEHFGALGRTDGKFKDAAFKLFWSRGRLFVNILGDDHLLVSFCKHITKDVGDLQPNFSALARFDLNMEQANCMIARAMAVSQE